jgi:hypothetical protein
MKNLFKREDTYSDEPMIIGADTADEASLRLTQLSWSNPLLIVIVLIVAVLGTYLILNSSADTTAASKVWSTASAWDSGALSNTSVSGNSVVLSSKITTSSSTPSSVNLALGKNATASSTSSGKPSYVTDGTTSTRWTSNTKTGQWIYVDLDKATSIGRVSLTWANSNARNYEIQVSSDASHWTTIYSNARGVGGVNNITGLKATDRYVSVYISQL